MKEMIRTLVETWGPSGNEEIIRETISGLVKDYVDELRTDALGNLIAVKKGKGGKKIMVAAHMDEIGVMVTHIDENGFLRFTNVGGVNPFVLLGERVVFKNGTVGVFGMEKLDDMKDLKLPKMYLDIGCSSKEEAAQKVSIGDVAVFKREMQDLGDRLVAKAMDDRIGCAVLIEALKQLQETDNEVYGVFTVQEEVGLRGAKVSAFALEPDLGIALDVTSTGDTPKAHTMDVALGKGPTVKVKDMSIVCHPAVKKLMADVAEKNYIPYQYEVLEFGGTDSGAIHLTRSGVPSGVISIPTRNLHSPSEVVDYNDVQNAVKLLVKILEQKI